MGLVQAMQAERQGKQTSIHSTPWKKVSFAIEWST